MNAKLRAARAALDLLPTSGVIGLGTGSTAALFIDGLAELVRSGRSYQGVPTSDASRRQAESLGIPLLTADGPWEIDVCVDGADEVSDALDLIKGGGGAHTREKIVNASARTNVIVVDEAKLSMRLGERWAVPVEVLPFGWRSTLRALGELGPARRRESRERSGEPFVSDSGGFVIDVATGPIDDPGALDARIHALPGVIETGLFVGRASIVLVAGTAGVRELRA